MCSFKQEDFFIKKTTKELNAKTSTATRMTNKQLINLVYMFL